MGPVNPKSIIGEGSAFAPEQIDGLLNQLAEPFPPELVAWRVTATTRDRRGNRGQVVAYADQRAYTDRLNNIFTPLGWTREYTVQTVQNFERPQRNESGAKDSSIAAKVMVTCRVTIFGMGTHSGTGEEWATDKNALTRAEAQAFKRACSCFGLGRYFYDLPRTWVDLDDQRRPLEHPRLPDWALPKQTEPGRNGTSGNGTAAKSDSAKNGKLRQNGRDSLYRNELLAAVRKFSEEIGYSLSREALRRMAGTEDLDRVQDLAKLSGAMERMQDVARGVAHLKSAREVLGDDQYRHLCTRPGFAERRRQDQHPDSGGPENAGGPHGEVAGWSCEEESRRRKRRSEGGRFAGIARRLESTPVGASQADLRPRVARALGMWFRRQAMEHCALAMSDG